MVNINQKKILYLSNSEYEKMVFLIEKYKKKYYEKMLFIKLLSSKQNVIYEQNILVKKIINDLINNYDFIKKNKICVFLTGSYARCTNKIYSDIDLQFCYCIQNIDICECMKYEEIIYYMIGEIFGIGRLKVHNNMITKMNDYIDKDMKMLECKIIVDNKLKIKYENYEKRYNIQYNYDKSIKALFKYLLSNVYNDNLEYNHVFYVFTEKRIFNNHYKKLLEVEKNILNIDRILKRKEIIIEDINKLDKFVLENCNFDMITFKRTFQRDEFDILYNYISLCRDLFIYSGHTWDYININDNKELLTDKIFNEILEYLIHYFDIVNQFKNEYSIHKNMLVDNSIVNVVKMNLIYINGRIGDTLNERFNNNDANCTL